MSHFSVGADAPLFIVLNASSGREATDSQRATIADALEHAVPGRLMLLMPEAAVERDAA